MRTIVFAHAAIAIGAAGVGQTYQLPNEMAAWAGCIHTVLVTTATVGNRVLAVRLLDATGNVLCENQGNSIAASSTSKTIWGPSLPNAGTSGQYGWVPLPYMSLPPNAQLNVFDLNGIDVTDTIQTSMTLADPR